MAAKLTLITTRRVEQVEAEVLADAVAAMEGWVDRLPVESSWRWTFTATRAELARGAEHLRRGCGGEDES